MNTKNGQISGYLSQRGRSARGVPLLAKPFVGRKSSTPEQLEYFCSKVEGLLVVLLVFHVKLISFDSHVPL